MKKKGGKRLEKIGAIRGSRRVLRGKSRVDRKGGLATGGVGGKSSAFRSQISKENAIEKGRGLIFERREWVENGIRLGHKGGGRVAGRMLFKKLAIDDQGETKKKSKRKKKKKEVENRVSS